MDNESKNAFSFNPWNSTPGRWLQYVFKSMVKNTIFFFHRQILRHYDKDAFVFDDARLRYDRAEISKFLDEWVEIRIQEIVNAAADIFFFILKEDGRYRRLYIVFRNKMIMEGHIYGLSSIEQEELTKWKGK